MTPGSVEALVYLLGVAALVSAAAGIVRELDAARRERERNGGRR